MSYCEECNKIMLDDEECYHEEEEEVKCQTKVKVTTWKEELLIN